MKIEVNRVNEEEYDFTLDAEGENQQIVCEIAAGLASMLRDIAPNHQIRSIALATTTSLAKGLLDRLEHSRKSHAKNGIPFDEDYALQEICTTFLFDDNFEAIKNISRSAISLMATEDTIDEQDN
jgi:hypothetical protein